MAQYKSSGLDSKALAERKSKRLEEALSAYTPEQTKLTVNKLLEDFVDESGNNYFEAGKRDTTLYFADENYIKEKFNNNCKLKEDKFNSYKNIASEIIEEYFNKKVYHVIPSSDRPLKKITFLASEFSVTDNAKEVRVTSEGVFALLMSNGWITLNDGIGVYTL